MGCRQPKNKALFGLIKMKGMIMSQYMGLIARVFLSSYYLVSILMVLFLIFTNQITYETYQIGLMQNGFYGFFAPLSILVQMVFGVLFLIGYKIKISAYILSFYSLILAFFTFYAGASPDFIFKTLMYFSFFGAFLFFGSKPEMPYSLDSLCASRKK
jgi:putative oxidoreductase